MAGLGVSRRPPAPIEPTVNVTRKAWASLNQSLLAAHAEIVRLQKIIDGLPQSGRVGLAFISHQAQGARNTCPSPNKETISD